MVHKMKKRKIDSLLSEPEQDKLRSLLQSMRDDVRLDLWAAKRDDKPDAIAHYKGLAKWRNDRQMILHKLFLKLDMHSIGEIQDLMEEK